MNIEEGQLVVAVEVGQTDPWAWLEENSPETRAWQQARDGEAMAALRGWEGWAGLRDRVAERSAAGRSVAPVPAGGRWFHWSVAPGAGARIEVSEAVDGPRRRIWSATSTQTVTGLLPSPVGDRVAVAVAEGGQEWEGRLFLIDVDTAQVTNELPFSPIASGLAWLPDGTGFYYTRPAPGRAGLGLWFHPTDDAAYESPEPIDMPEGVGGGPLVSSDGRFVALTLADTEIRPRFILDRSHPEAGWRPFMAGVTGEWRGVLLGDDYIAVTTVDAPRGRLVRVPLAGADDSATHQTIVPESDAVLRAVSVAAGPSLVLSEFVEAACRIRAVTVTGQRLGEAVFDEPVTLMTDGRVVPSLGTPMATSSPDSHEVGLVVGSMTKSAALAGWRIGKPVPSMLTEPLIELEGVEIVLRHATSPDGTGVPYYLLRPTGASSAGPCVLNGYGGYNIPQLPRYQSWVAVLLDYGVSVAVAIQRGGGEFGQDWYEAARYARRQNSFDDLYAVADDLIASGVTTPAQLGFYGASNGGLLAGMAICQRPELFGAVVAVAPLTDLVASGRDPLSAYLIRQDFGDPDRAEDAGQLAAASPYRCFKAGQRVPPTLIACPGEDLRCPPWHGRKFAAALEAGAPGGGSVLLRVWEGGGHLGGGSSTTPAERTAEWLGFLLAHIG
ncbi:MAG: prolyl oligopeptidase family serine peptidase [Acidimicrobiales bacterium]